MKLDQALVDAAITQMQRRWAPHQESGAAAVYLDDGQTLTSVCLPNIVNGGVSLCHETGAFCQAFTLGRQVTASVCVSRLPDQQQIIILPVPLQNSPHAG